MSDLERGARIRREVLGDEYVDRTQAGEDKLPEAFQDYVTRCAWGEVWDRPGLGRRERSLVTLGVLVALRAERELAIHLRGALRNGLSEEEIEEALMHTAVYAGAPAALTAFGVARKVFSGRESPE